MSALIWTDGQLADEVNVSTRTLRKWRQLGEGPTFVRVGRTPMYRPSDVAAWVDSLPAVERSTYELRRVG